jgi:hypothetical protein
MINQGKFYKFPFLFSPASRDKTLESLPPTIKPTTGYLAGC